MFRNGCTVPVPFKLSFDFDLSIAPGASVVEKCLDVEDMRRGRVWLAEVAVVVAVVVVEPGCEFARNLGAVE